MQSYDPVVLCDWLFWLTSCFQGSSWRMSQDILLYCQVIFHWADCHISFVCNQLLGLSCFRSLVIPNKAAMNIWVVSALWRFWIRLLWTFMDELWGHSLGSVPRQEATAPCGNSVCGHRSRSSQTTSKTTYLHPRSVYLALDGPTSSPTLVVLGLFDSSHPRSLQSD